MAPVLGGIAPMLIPSTTSAASQGAGVGSLESTADVNVEARREHARSGPIADLISNCGSPDTALRFMSQEPLIDEFIGEWSKPHLEAVLGTLKHIATGSVDKMRKKLREAVAHYREEHPNQPAIDSDAAAMSSSNEDPLAAPQPTGRRKLPARAAKKAAAAVGASASAPSPVAVARKKARDPSPDPSESSDPSTDSDDSFRIARASSKALQELAKSKPISSSPSPRRSKRVDREQSPPSRPSRPPIVKNKSRHVEAALMSDEDFASDPSSDSNDSEDDEFDIDADRLVDPSAYSRREQTSRRAQREMEHEQMERVGHGRSMARGFIANALRNSGYRTLLQVFKNDVTIKDHRTRREILVLCRSIDALREGNASKAMEIIVRRLAGLHTADSTGNWKIADAFEESTENASFVPEHLMHAALKRVVQRQAVEKAAAPTRSYGSSSARGSFDREGHGGTGSYRGAGAGASSYNRASSYKKTNKDDRDNRDNNTNQSSGASSSSRQFNGGKAKGSDRK